MWVLEKIKNSIKLLHHLKDISSQQSQMKWVVKGTAPAIISSLPQHVFAPGKQQTPQAEFCRMLQLQQGQAQVVLHCLGTSRYFQPVTMDSDSFRLYLQLQMKQVRDSTGILRFDQDHVNCSGCLHLKAAVYDRGGQGSVESGRGIFPLLCNTSSLFAICSLL